MKKIEVTDIDDSKVDHGAGRATVNIQTTDGPAALSLTTEQIGALVPILASLLGKLSAPRSGRAQAQIVFPARDLLLGWTDSGALGLVLALQGDLEMSFSVPAEALPRILTRLQELEALRKASPSGAQPH